MPHRERHEEPARPLVPQILPEEEPLGEELSDEEPRVLGGQWVLCEVCSVLYDLRSSDGLCGYCAGEACGPPEEED